MTNSKTNANATRTLFFDAKKRDLGRARWEQHFSGRPGCSVHGLANDDDENDELGQGVAISLPAEVANAWDRAMQQVRGRLRGGQAARLIERKLDNVAPRGGNTSASGDIDYHEDGVGRRTYFRVGYRIEAVEGEDHDTGVITEVDGDDVTVAWRGSEQITTQPYSALIPCRTWAE